MVLEMVDIDDESYSRSRSLLLMNAEESADTAATSRYLDQIMALPENRYNPVFLSKKARYQVNTRDYSGALKTAELAERYWGRIPSALVFDTKFPSVNGGLQPVEA